MKTLASPSRWGSFLALSVASLGAAPALGADAASDNASASVYFQFANPDGLNGLNGGTGFGPWTTTKLIVGAQPNWPGFAGWFQAYGQGGPNPTNPDLQDATSTPNFNAWGSYANTTQPGQGLSTTVASRAFSGGPLEIGQTFTVSFEHGNVSFYPPVLDLRLFGWVGVVLHTTPSYGADPFLNGIGFGGVVGFGFPGGAANYQIVTAGGSTIDSGIPFTQRGLKLEFTRTSPSELSLRVTRLNDNSIFTFSNISAAGQLNGFGLVNRNSREANVYFNNLSVTGNPATQGACCTGSACVLRQAQDCSGPGLRFAGQATTCNAPGNALTPCCKADFNQDLSVTVQDIFDFLAAWFAGDTRADFNQAGGVGVQDIFDFLAAWFAGCGV